MARKKTEELSLPVEKTGEEPTVAEETLPVTETAEATEVQIPEASTESTIPLEAIQQDPGETAAPAKPRKRELPRRKKQRSKKQKP